MWTLNVGSSFWNRFKAREKFGVSAPTGLMASEMTGSGTNMDVWSNVSAVRWIQIEGLTIEKFVDPSVKVSPDEHSTPNMAQISPGPIESIS